MIESFVDLTYRGLALGRRIKLTQVRPTSAYLELPMPMPVGTQIAIATDEGVTLDATVTRIHEQVGGSDRVPGMTVRPQLGSQDAIGWWQARVALPEEPAVAEPPTRSRPITVRPRTHTVPHAVSVPPVPPDAKPLASEVTETKELSVYVPEPEPPRPDDVKSTVIMNAVDQEMLQKLTQSDGEVERLTRRTGEHEVVDDGLRTTVMDAVDPSALGLDVTASGSFRAVTDNGEDEDDKDDKEPSPTASQPGAKKKRKKRR